MRLRSQYTALVLLALTAGCIDTEPTGPSTPSKRFDVGAAAAGEARIRIGVVQSATSITLASAADYSVSGRNTGNVFLTGSAGSITVTASGAVTRRKLQVFCTNNADMIASRKAAAEALGHPTYLEVIPACTRLYIGDMPVNTPPAQQTEYKNLLISQGLAASDAFYRIVQIATVSYTIRRGTEPPVVVTEPVVLSSSDDRVTINGTPFRGRGQAVINSGGTLAGVNDLPIEQYLYGVVPLELGPTVFPEVEAQKAQAVAARTYALSGLGKRAADGYDLLPTTSDQVYGGLSAEHPISTQAVNETRGVVLKHEGKLISALYSSTSGGHSADNEEAFNSVAVPYLRGVPDAPRGQAFEHVPSLEVFRSHANPTSLRAASEGTFDSDWSRLHRWTYEWTNAEITQVLSAWAQRPVGKVLAINVLSRGPSGRVTLIEYVTEDGTYTHTRDAIRSSLRFINANGTASNLPSTLFFVEPVLDRKSGELSGFRVYGGGFGHGVGMSQTGAVGMAEKKRTYDEILKHYYRDVELVVEY